MKKKVLFSRFFAKNMIFYSVLLIGLLFSIHSKAQFRSPQSRGIFPSEGFGSSSSSSGGVYQPFQSTSPFSSTYQQTPFGSQGLDPVLYGPGGNPIGGLPVSDGMEVLLFAVLVYGMYKKVKVLNSNRIEKVIL